MAEHKMLILDGVRYRSDELTADQIKKAEADRERAAELPDRTGEAKPLTTPKRTRRPGPVEDDTTK